MLTYRLYDISYGFPIYLLPTFILNVSVSFFLPTQSNCFDLELSPVTFMFKFFFLYCYHLGLSLSLPYFSHFWSGSYIPYFYSITG